MTTTLSTVCLQKMFKISQHLVKIWKKVRRHLFYGLRCILTRQGTRTAPLDTIRSEHNSDSWQLIIWIWYVVKFPLSH